MMLALVLLSLTLVDGLNEKIVCPDQEYQCVQGQTCCKLAIGGWGCCPFNNAVCCSDEVHCCPGGTRCDLKEGYCKRGKQYWVDTVRNMIVRPDAPSAPAKLSRPPKERYTVPAFELISHNLRNVSNFDCGEGHVTCEGDVCCQGGSTCCPKASGGMGCCPVLQGVCCEDKEHCCSPGFHCTSDGGCEFDPSPK